MWKLAITKQGQFERGGQGTLATPLVRCLASQTKFLLSNLAFGMKI